MKFELSVISPIYTHPFKRRFWIRKELEMLKSILFKKVLAKHNNLVNLHDSTPIFQANMHQNEGQNRANLLGY